MILSTDNTTHADREKERILAVDDTPANLRLLMQMLGEHGYIVHPATSGQSALRFLETMLPDIILLDVIMPEMNGYRLCEMLKADERTRDIPVIFVSSADQGLDKMKAFASGGVDYIVNGIGHNSSNTALVTAVIGWRKAFISKPLPRAWRRHSKPAS